MSSSFSRGFVKQAQHDAALFTSKLRRVHSRVFRRGRCPHPAEVRYLRDLQAVANAIAWLARHSYENREPAPGHFICSNCRREFEKGWTEAEAMAEAEARYPGVGFVDMDVVCEDCEAEFSAWYERHGANE